MRRLSYILLLIVFCSFMEAQPFAVGNTCCNYYSINKNFAPTSGCGAVPDDYSFDIDGDVVSDIKIQSYSSGPCFGGGAQSRGIVLSSTANVEFVYTTGLTGCPYSPIIQNLSAGTMLNSSLNWSLATTSSSTQAAPHLYSYAWSTAGSWTCGVQTNPFYVGFRKIIQSTDTIYGWIRVNTNFPGILYDYAYTCGSYTAAPPSSVFTNTTGVVCAGVSLSLTASPSPGVFSGSGVSGSVFNSTVTGNHVVYYTAANPAGCSTTKSSFSVFVSGYPSVSFSNTPSSVCFDEDLNLSGSPPGGTFSGTGVTGSVFSSSVTGLGNQPVYYSYANPNGCSKTATLNIQVNSCVGIKESESGSSGIRIFPNPNNGNFNLTAEFISGEIQVYNAIGKLIISEVISGNREINLEKESSGIYYLQFTDGNNRRFFSKIIKN